MIPWLDPVVPHVKVLHIAALALWAAGLFALPLMLSRHGPGMAQTDYDNVRRATHYGYTFIVTPAALIAIGSGTLLVFLREVFVTWMFAKLVFVAIMVAFHVWIGHVLVDMVETEGTRSPPNPGPSLLVLIPIIAILFLVLAKPDLTAIPVPDWLREPRGNQLPFDVPR